MSWMTISSSVGGDLRVPARDHVLDQHHVEVAGPADDDLPIHPKRELAALVLARDEAKRELGTVGHAQRLRVWPSSTSRGSPESKDSLQRWRESLTRLARRRSCSASVGTYDRACARRRPTHLGHARPLFSQDAIDWLARCRARPSIWCSPIPRTTPGGRAGTASPTRPPTSTGRRAGWRKRRASSSRRLALHLRLLRAARRSQGAGRDAHFAGAAAGWSGTTATRATSGATGGAAHESIVHLRHRELRPQRRRGAGPLQRAYAPLSLASTGRDARATAAHLRWQPHPLGAKPRDVLEMPTLTNGMREKTAHPTQKPLELVRRLVAAASRPGALVVDPFAGSGTTFVACEALGRRWLGCENQSRLSAASSPTA